MKSLCYWCEQPLPKKAIASKSIFCGKGCETDHEKNSYPSWMTGRIGPTPNQDWHMSCDYLCLSAPNKYRRIFRKRGELSALQDEIMSLQKTDFPHLWGELGCDIDWPSWDLVILWKGPTRHDVRT